MKTFRPEVILSSAPGRFFKGKFILVGATVPQVQPQPIGELIDPYQIKSESRINILADFDKGEMAITSCPGITGHAAAVSPIMRWLLFRMKSRMNYLFSDEH